ncbi:MAG TPA: DUF493 family protein [Xanthomonadales bacterium]|nr:DUF493 family protein [Xanthomonadales bacterium]
MSETQTDAPRGFQFPGTFEITAMGEALPELEAIVMSELVALGCTPDPGTVRHRSSSGGKYLAVSITFECDTRERYQAAHARLRAHPAIRWTL